MEFILVFFVVLTCVYVIEGETFMVKWRIINTFKADSSDAFYIDFVGSEGAEGPFLLNPQGNYMAKGQTCQAIVMTAGKIGSLKQVDTWKDPDDGMKVSTVEVIDMYNFPRRWIWTCNCWYDSGWFGRTNDKQYTGSMFAAVTRKYGEKQLSSRLPVGIISTTEFSQCSMTTCTLHCARTGGCTAFNLGRGLPNKGCVCELLNVHTPLIPSVQSMMEANQDYTFVQQKIMQQ